MTHEELQLKRQRSTQTRQGSEFRSMVWCWCKIRNSSSCNGWWTAARPAAATFDEAVNRITNFVCTYKLQRYMKRSPLIQIYVHICFNLSLVVEISFVIQATHIIHGQRASGYTNTKKCSGFNSQSHESTWIYWRRNQHEYHEHTWRAAVFLRFFGEFI